MGMGLVGPIVAMALLSTCAERLQQQLGSSTLRHKSRWERYVWASGAGRFTGRGEKASCLHYHVQPGKRT